MSKCTVTSIIYKGESKEGLEKRSAHIKCLVNEEPADPYNNSIAVH